LIGQGLVLNDIIESLEEEEEGSGLLDFLARWGLLMVPAAILGAGLGYLYSRQLPRVYAAETSVLAEVNAQSVLKEVDSQNDNRNNYSVFNTREFYATQIQVVRSRDMAERVATSLRLLDRPSWLEPLKKADKKADSDRLAERTVALLRSGFSVDRERFARILQMRFEHTDPELAAEIVNSFAEEFVDRAASRRTKAHKEAYAWLKAEEKRLRKQLEAVEESIDQFKIEHGLLSSDLEHSRSLQWESLARLAKARDEVQIQRMRLGEELSALEGLDQAAKVAALTERAKARHLTLATVQGQLAHGRTDLAKKGARYEAQHESMKELRENVGALRSERDQLVTAEIAHLVASHDALRREEGKLSGRIATARGKAIEINTLNLRYQRLDRQKNNRQKMLATVADQLLTTGMTVRLENNNVHVLDHAAVPTVPVRPLVKVYATGGGLLGLVAAVLLALLVELLQTTVQSMEFVQRISRGHCLGVVDSMRDRGTLAPDLAVQLKPRSNLAEQFRSIRSNLMFMNVDKPLRTLSVTSPSPQDGKTFCAVSTAIVFAQSGAKVLLVDTDLRRGRLHRVFEVPGDIGIVNLLAGDKTVTEACAQTEVPNLDLLPSGPHPPNPAELLHSDSFGRVKEDLLKHYDMVVFDTPPVNLVTDAVILGNRTDGLLLVARHQRTNKGDLRHCMERLRTSGVPVLGFIFNGRRQAGGLYGYYYGRYGYRYGRYGYQYGSYGSDAYGIEKA
jgi:succinoglycan biosynthesis transport protein ExoP